MSKTQYSAGKSGESDDTLYLASANDSADSTHEGAGHSFLVGNQSS